MEPVFQYGTFYYISVVGSAVFIYVVFIFTFGFLAATAIIVWAILFFPAVIAIGCLRWSFGCTNFFYFLIAIAAVLGLSYILVAYNVPSFVAASTAIIIVGWPIMLLALSDYTPSR